MFEFNGKLYAPKGEYITTPKEYQELQVGQRYVECCGCIYKCINKDSNRSHLIELSETCEKDGILLGSVMYPDDDDIVDMIVDIPELSGLLEVVSQA